MLTETDQELQTLIMREFELDEQLFAFVKIQEHLSDEGYWTLLGQLYRACEHPWMINSFIGTLFHMDRPGKLEYLMHPAERVSMSADMMRNVVTIYRGCWSANDTGWNYCLTRPEAAAFAREYPLDGQPIIIRAKVHRNNIEAVFHCDRGLTVVVDPRRIVVRDVKPIRFAKKKEEERVNARLLQGVTALDPHWQRLQFLMPVVHTLVALDNASEDQRETARIQIMTNFWERAQKLDEWGFTDMRDKVQNQALLIKEPTEEVQDWVKHFKAMRAQNEGETPLTV